MKIPFEDLSGYHLLVMVMKEKKQNRFMLICITEKYLPKYPVEMTPWEYQPKKE